MRLQAGRIGYMCSSLIMESETELGTYMRRGIRSKTEAMCRVSKASATYLLPWVSSERSSSKPDLGERSGHIILLREGTFVLQIHIPSMMHNSRLQLTDRSHPKEMSASHASTLNS